MGTEYEEALGLNLYEMPLRSYDPAIARWTTIDPVVHHSNSTYNGYDNNPIYWSDPSGASVEKIEGGTKYTGEDAKVAFLNLAKRKKVKGKKKEKAKEDNGSSSGRRRARQRTRNRSRVGSGSLFFDARGQELLSHWLDGSGRDLDLSSEEWQEYMKDNEMLETQVIVALFNYIGDNLGKFNDGKSVNFKTSFHGLLDNGYFTGYQMLHGSSSTLGDVQLKGTIIYNKKAESYEVNYEGVWNDRMDPNPIYREDTALTNALNLFYNPKDYNVKVRWKGTYIHKFK